MHAHKIEYRHACIRTYMHIVCKLGTGFSDEQLELFSRTLMPHQVSPPPPHPYLCLWMQTYRHTYIHTSGASAAGAGPGKGLAKPSRLLVPMLGAICVYTSWRVRSLMIIDHIGYDVP